MLYQSIQLNNHDKYLEFLRNLKPRTRYIEVLINDEKDMHLIEKFKKDIISKSEVNTWWNLNNLELIPCKLYRFDVSAEFWTHLESYQTFGYFEAPGIEAEDNYSDFGKNDIAFLDENENIIMRTDIKNGFIDVVYETE